MSGVYYNEIDKHAAAWLRELIRRGLIAAGDVDERSIEDVRPVDLRGYTQCHFFAGIGVWPYALRLAGWPDSRLVWTGSCPCQPFSEAGAGAGFADERHLWPAWFHLIAQCRPAAIYGEQVASKAALRWLDLVFADMEGAHYACGAADLCAASVGAPHIRQRILWVADAMHAKRRALAPRRRDVLDRHDARREEATSRPAVRGTAGALADDDGQRLAWRPESNGIEEQFGQRAPRRHNARGRRADGVAQGAPARQAAECTGDAGFWSDVEWIECADGRARPVEPGVSPLVDGATARVVRLRGYGNAIVPQLAAEFIRAAVDCGVGADQLAGAAA